MATDYSRKRRDDDAPGIFVVRLGEGDGARYAVCEGLQTVSGDYCLPGSGKTVAELVKEQGLMAGFMSEDDCGDVRFMAFTGRSGRNITININ